MKKFLNLRGQAAVEFSLLLPIFALILFATIYLGMFIIDYVTLDNAAAQAARHAAMNSPSYEILQEDKDKIESTKLLFRWYELKKNRCIKSSLGSLVEDSEGNLEFEENASGDHVRVMIQATWREDKSDSILGDILKDRYTVLKIVKKEET